MPKEPRDVQKLPPMVAFLQITLSQCKRQFALLHHFLSSKNTGNDSIDCPCFTLKTELDILNQGTKASKATSGAIAFLSMNPRQCK
jgi:hypothetical protein